jgi:hypothetical protein
MKKIRNDKSFGDIIQIHMEISQGISLCNYLYFQQTKMSCSFYLSSFFFYKIGKWKGRTGWGKGARIGTSGRGRW